MPEVTSSSSASGLEGGLDPTTGETDYDVIPPDWARYLSRDDRGHFEVTSASGSEGEAHGFGSSSEPRPNEGRGFPNFDVDRDEHGLWTVADHFGAAMGIGDTPMEALHQWEELATEQHKDLISNADRLHPRLRQQRAFLSSWFGR